MHILHARFRSVTTVAAIALVASLLPATSVEAGLRAGAAKVDVTNLDAGPVNDPLYVRALVVSDGTTTAAIVSVDAVAIAEIGSIRNEYLSVVRAQLQKELKLEPKNLLVNASHCHGIVCSDIEARTVRAVKEAARNLVPVRIGVGRGHEDRISENRRMKLKNGREADVRHAYSLPADAEIAEVGPIDPEIGILRLDREDGSTLAVVYNFACHPIQGVPSGGNTADITGFSSKVIEENLSDGTVALFLQGCGGDINPIGYKDVDHPRNAETLGNLLGLSALRAVRKIEMRNDDRLTLRSETLALPRADFAPKIADREAEIERLTKTLQGTSINLKSFLSLVVKYNVFPDFPSSESHGYFHEKKLGRADLSRLDATNRQQMQQYIANIHTMEELTRVQTNLALLKKHHAQTVAAGKRTLDVELAALRIGDFVLLTFPGELTVRIGQNIKKASPHKETFVAGYTNGYIYYAPTAEQLLNFGNAQEDSDTLVAPEWQEIFETKAAQMLKGL
ncbi:MAG: hypothetical protein AB7O26_18395 [Planctomycetaceae bacterium]